MSKADFPQNIQDDTKRQRGGESTDEIELRPDGDERFRKAVHAAVKSGPKHREAKP